MNTCIAAAKGQRWRWVGILCLLAPLSMVVQPAADADAQGEVLTWRSARDPGPGGVITPVDLALSAGSGWLVLDRALHRAQRVSLDGAAPTVSGAGPGTSPGELDSPLGVALDEARDRVYVADTFNRRIVIFDRAGALVGTWATGLQQPEALTLGLDGRVYVYDRGRNALVAFRPDGAQDVVVPVQRAISDIAELPSGVATSPRGTLFFAAENPVANQDNVLYEYSAEGDTLRPRTRVGWRIRDVSFDAGGELLLLDGAAHALVAGFDRDSGLGDVRLPLGRGAIALVGGATGEAHILFAANDLGPSRIERWDWRARSRVGSHALPLPDGAWTPGPLRLDGAREGPLLLVDILERLLVWRVEGTSRREANDPASGTIEVEGQARMPGLVAAAAVGDGSSDVIVARVRTAATGDDPGDPDAPPPGRRVARLERIARPDDPLGIEPVARRWRFEAMRPITATELTSIVALAADADPAVARVFALDSAGAQVLVAGLRDGAPAKEGAWPLPDLPGQPGWVDLAVGAEGVAVLHAGSGQVALFDPRTGALRRTVSLDAPALPLRLAAHPQGGWIGALVDRRLVAFDREGRAGMILDLPVEEAGPPGRPAEAPSDVWVDGQGHAYVADLEARAVHRLGGQRVEDMARLFLPRLLR